MDLNASDEEIRRAAESALAMTGDVDVLVNNAASIVAAVGPVEEMRFGD